MPKKELKTRGELLGQLAKGLWEARDALFQLQALDPRTEEERDAIEDAITKLRDIGGDDIRPDHSSGLLCLLTSKICVECRGQVYDKQGCVLCRCDFCGKADKYAATSYCAECKACEAKRLDNAEPSDADLAAHYGYGSSSPQSLDEQCAAARLQKEGR